VVSGTTIESLVYNGQVDDVTLDLNTARPIVSGGTGANNAAGGLFNLGGEKATQVVTSYDSHVWVPGSFRSAVGATGAPNANAFAGVCYIGEALANPPTNQNVVVEARDLSDTADPGIVYVRQKIAGVWGGWVAEAGRSNSVFVDADQTFTETQKAQGRENIYAAPFDALAYNGMQINGSMEVSQQLGTTVTATNGAYPADGWRFGFSGTMTPSSAQVIIASPFGNSGLPSHIYATSGTAQPSLGANDFVILSQAIEGYRIARLAWGTVGAQSITIGFWAYHAVAGTYGGSIRNNTGTRSYAFNYTVAAITAQYVTVTIPGDISGTWATDNTGGLILTFAQAAGSSFVAPSLNTWVAGNFFAPPGSINASAAAGGHMRITGVVVLPGIEAPSAARSSLIMRPYDQELTVCKRYWQKLGGSAAVDILISGYAPAGANVAHTLFYPVEMRAVPTTAINGGWTTSNGGAYSLSGPGTKSIGTQIVALATGMVTLYTTNTTCFISLDARL
jgi:hypothetical protein